MPHQPPTARAEAIHAAAVALAPDARRRHIDAACGDDAGLRREVEQLLADDEATLVIASSHHRPTSAAPKDQVHDQDDETGTRLGHWRLLRPLGQGGVGIVHEARRDGDGGQRAAIKRLRHHLDEPEHRGRFDDERRILARLSHAHIPALIDHGVDGMGHPWFALEFVDGGNLLDYADREKLGLRQRIALFLRVAGAVQYAHEHFVVHRDLKPGNILVGDDGHPKVLDFGTAKRLDADTGQTRTGMHAGFTPSYAAPEQIAGGTVSAATDVYALGIILYELICGTRPYLIEKENLLQAAETISHQEPARMDRTLNAGSREQLTARMGNRQTTTDAYRRFVRGDLNRIVQTALAKEPARRYASVEAFSNDLKRFLDGKPVSVSGNTLRYRARKFASRNPAAVLMAVLALLAVIGGLIATTWQMREAQHQAAEARHQQARAVQEADKAKREYERAKQTNQFLREVFESPRAIGSAPRQVTLYQALDHALHLAQERKLTPDLKIRTLVAASTSFDTMGEQQRAEEVLQHALTLQEAQAPEDVELRARVLSGLAWINARNDMAQAERQGDEALRLARQARPRSEETLLGALSTMQLIRMRQRDFAAAVELLRETRQLVMHSGDSSKSDMLVLWENEGILQARLKREAESRHAHAEAIRLADEIYGEDKLIPLLERQYFADSLNHLTHWSEAIGLYEELRTKLKHAAGDDSDEYQLFNYRIGTAYNNAGRYRDALPPLAEAWDYGLRADFRGKQLWTAEEYSRALAQTGQCGKAKQVLNHLAREDGHDHRQRKAYKDSPCR